MFGSERPWRTVGDGTVALTAAYGQYGESHEGRSSAICQDDGVVSGAEVESRRRLVGRGQVEGRSGLVTNPHPTRRTLFSHDRQGDVKGSLCGSGEKQR